VGMLKNILKEDSKNDVQVKAAGLLEEIKKKSSTQLERSKEPKAAVPVQEALPVGQKSRDRGQQAHEMMQQAQEDFRTQQYLVCLVRCETISNRFADLPEGRQATELVEKITTN